MIFNQYLFSEFISKEHVIREIRVQLASEYYALHKKTIMKVSHCFDRVFVLMFFCILLVNLTLLSSTLHTINKA